MDEGRPMTKGIIMCGKTTTSRKGTMGRVSKTSIGGIDLAGQLRATSYELTN